MTRRKRKDAGSGTVLLELAMVMPLLLLFVVGLFEFGRYFSQISWVAQTAYQATLLGGEKSPWPLVGSEPSGKWKSAVTDRALKLFNLQNHHIKNLPVNGPITPTFDNATRIVGVRIQGRFNSLWPGFMKLDLPVNVQVNGPMLIRANGDVGSLTAFENPTVMYDCTRQAVGTASSTECCGSGGWPACL